MPTRFEGELLRYNRKVTRSGGDGLGLTSSCKSWLRQHLAMVPFSLSFRLKHSIPIFTVQLSYIICSIKDTHYQVHIGCDDLEMYRVRAQEHRRKKMVRV